MAALRASKVREVHVIGRRGPAHAKFTTKELRELGDLPGVTVSVAAAASSTWTRLRPVGPVRRAGGDRPPRPRQPGRDARLGFRSGAGRRAARQLRLHFWLRPVEILGTEGRLAESPASARAYRRRRIRGHR